MNHFSERRSRLFGASGDGEVKSRFPVTHADRDAQKRLLLGYPINFNSPPEAFFRWREQLQSKGIGRFAWNNGGNPYQPAPVSYNSHAYERELIERFGKIYRFPAGQLWGFLSNSGTDSNMQGMYMGRTLLKGRTGRLPKCYFTREAHYSIQILADQLGLESVFVDTLPDAGLDPQDLARKMAANRNDPVLVVATVGTTFKGGIDRIEKIQEVVQGQPAYVHVDAALFGGYLPHTLFAPAVHYTGSGACRPRYDSLAVSCHKFFGFHSPAGLFISSKATFDEFNRLFSRVHSPEYIGHVPGTIACSRDAVKPAEFYYYSSPEDLARQAGDVKVMLDNSQYLLKALQMHFPRLLPRRVNEASNIIFFKQPAPWIVDKYSLATMKLAGVDFAHVVVMPHVTQSVIDEFLSDLEEGSHG